jgi:hypothetical protein
VVAQILLVVEPVGAYLFSGAFDEGFAVLVEPESGRFGQRDAVFFEKCTSDEFVFAVGDGVGIHFQVDGINGGLLGCRLSGPLAFAAGMPVQLIGGLPAIFSLVEADNDTAVPVAGSAGIRRPRFRLSGGRSAIEFVGFVGN